MNQQYRNVFAEMGIPEDAVSKRLEEIKHQFFYGEDSFYHEAGEDMAYVEGTGNWDARTEGMS